MEPFDTINDSIETIARFSKDDPRRHAMVRHVMNLARKEQRLSEFQPAAQFSVGLSSLIVGGVFLGVGIDAGGWAHALTALGGLLSIFGVSGATMGIATAAERKKEATRR